MHWFNQDTLENCFSQIRKQVGATPTATKCFQALRIVTSGQFISDVQQTSYFSNSNVFLLNHFTNEEYAIIENCKLLPTLFYHSPNFAETLPTIILENIGNTVTEISLN